MAEARRRRMARGLGIAALAAAAVGAVWAALRPKAPREFETGPPVFAGESTKLAATRIVPTLDTPVDGGTNAIWCATLQMAWKELQAGPVGGPLTLDAATSAAQMLNAAADPEPDLPEGAYYAAGGIATEKFLAEIRKTMEKRFPGEMTVDLEPARNELVAYAFLKTQMLFTRPYFDAEEPVVFTGADGRATEIATFGIRDEDGDKIKLHEQPAVMFGWREALANKGRAEEFAIDLDRNSKELQIIVACVEWKGSLAETIGGVIKRVKSPDRENFDPFGPNDTLLVPELAFEISHHFAELEGRSLTNAAFGGWPILTAWQRIDFRLNRSGASLESESLLEAMAMQADYVCDRPFLIVMRKRESKAPFFAMWVANGELLRRWEDRAAGSFTGEEERRIDPQKR